MFSLVHQSLEEHARVHEKKEAVRFNGQSYSYGQLNQQATNLSELIGTCGINKNECIGIYMDKCFEFVSGIFGILKLGAAYVPMDVDTPESRIAGIISECDISILITTSSFIGKIEKIQAEAKTPLKVIVMSDQAALPDKKNFGLELVAFNQNKEKIVSEDACCDISADQLAAILYTSGSSGVPKGVMISHEMIMAFVGWSLDTFRINSHDRLISHAPFHFDLSLFDLFAAVTAGACMVILPKQRIGNPKYITRFMADEQITIWQSVPSVLVLLAKYGDWNQGSFEKLRHVLFAGEMMPVAYLRTLKKYLSNAEFHNIYGCTETNDTFMYTVPDENIPDPLPIGRPLPYVRYEIVNEQNLPVKSNEQGELLVNAPTMMPEYRSGDTSCFVHTGGIKYYRTRDIVARLPDGNLIYCGRNDNIIKSNGYRINLLEIEGCLKSHKDINEIAVFPLPDAEVGNKIFVIATVESGAIVTPIDLKQYCAGKLPKYAIPHFFEIRQQWLPKTSSGKVNVKKLLSEKLTECV